LKSSIFLATNVSDCGKMNVKLPVSLILKGMFLL